MLLYIDHVTGKAITWLMTVKNVFLFHFACRHAMSRLRKFSFDLCGFGFMRLLQVADDNKMLICESRRESGMQWSVTCICAFRLRNVNRFNKATRLGSWNNTGKTEIDVIVHFP